MSLMALGHVLAHRAVVVGREVAHVRHHTIPAMKDLHRVGGGTGFELFPDQRIGNAVIVAIDLDVVVDVYAHRLPLGHDIALGWKRLQRGSIQGGIERSTTPFPLAERTLIYALQEFRDGLVEIGDREELVVAQYGDEPA